MTNIDSGHNIHNNLFIKAFSNPENVKIFLKMALPEPIKNAVDFSKIKIEFTTYVSDEIKDHYSDIVVKTRLKTQEQEELDSDIYILMEHKSTAKKKFLVQVLKYMYFEWQNDVDKKKPLRVIIPIIFYHGKAEWKVPRSFADQFKVPDEIKEFLLNYRYVLFDTRDWNFLSEANRELKDNVFLLTALVLMKSAYNEDMETIRAIFKFWHEKGFIKDKEKILFFLSYISYTRDISLDELKKTLEESNIEGGDLMPSLAQQLKKEGRKEGKKEEKLETAKRMLLDDISIEKVIRYTGLTEKEIKSLMN
jgi:predicted transposase/invertase (TIGR01784 family)